MIDLLWSEERLREALENEPGLITKQDENGKTLLHYAARIGTLMGSTNASKILNVLFNAPGIDFTIKDNAGNTPVHVAAFYCEDRTTCQYVFPAFVKEATKHKFNFSTLGQQGQSVLHITTRTSYTDPRGLLGRINNVKNVLNNTTDSGLNVLSSSGSTAFYYAVNHLHLDEADALLDAGANPILFGSKDRDPLAMIEEYLKLFNEPLTQDEYADGRVNVSIHLEQLNALKQRVLSYAKTSSYNEIRKNSRILGQGSRTSTGSCLFKDIPPELLAKIAGFTGNPIVHNETESTKIASQHLGKPTQQSLLNMPQVTTFQLNVF